MPDSPYVTWRAWAEQWREWHDHRFIGEQNANAIERMTKDFAALHERLREIEITLSRMAAVKDTREPLHNMWQELRWWASLIAGIVLLLIMAFANFEKDLAKALVLAIINGVIGVLTKAAL